jgi:cyclophilin family peptidyl-prolyl cis-trans isomerase
LAQESKQRVKSRQKQGETMSKRKEELRRQREQRAKTIQLAGIALAVLVVALIVWMSWPKETPSNQQGGQFAPVTAKQYDAPPPMTIDTTKQYFATFKMAAGGEFVIQLYPDKAPLTVNNFVFLAREGYFDGTTFHRVLEGFMAQGGDPTGTGMGSPGYTFQNEDSDLTFDKAGVVAMANAGRDTNGSQFFITFGPAPYLNGNYTIFGQVIEGMEVVNKITRRDPTQRPDYTGDVIERITISER